VRRYLFVAQDILVPAGGSRSCLEAPLPGGVESAAIGRRDFDLGGEPCAAFMLGEEGAAAAARELGLRRMPFRQSLGEFDEASVKGALRGMALLRSLETARFCGACGGPLRDSNAPLPEGDPDEEDARPGDGDVGSDEAPGARICDACGRAHFPRISPAVIVLIRKGGKILLAHNSRFPGGRFGLIAGYVEAGEAIEETVRREVREEAGIEVRDLRYVMSQSWPFPDSLMLAFTAEWASGEARPDGDEITELRWCSASELPDIPPPGSVARSLIDRFVLDSGARLRP
jgi:NAD+ diphosphatase